MPDEKPVRRVGDYEFLDRLAVGGMGELWRVRHVTLDAIYIAKQLKEEYREDEEFLKRFFHEAKLVANLRHPNIVQVFGYDVEQTLYLMEYVEGMDLDVLMRTRRVLEFREKRTIIEVVADAIGYAHREVDLIHRDIKPSNVLVAINSPDDPIRRSSIKLTDFGIARVLSVDQRMTMSSGMVMGTVHYMAPEQFEGEALKYSDVYAIGVLYYQLLTGRLPFDGPTAFVIRDKHRQQTPPSPRELVPSIPAEDSALVMKCMAKAPKDRFQDGQELYDALVSMSPSSHSVRMPRTRPAPAQGTMVTQMTKRVEETGLLGDTQKTIPKMVSDVTQATIPIDKRRKPGEGPAAAPAPKPKAAAKPKSRLRIVKIGLIAVAALLVAVLLAPLYLPSRYEIRWDTLRSDPLDTPNGIRIEVCPKVGFGMMWREAGTVADKAPAHWSNWTTFFDGVDVRFSDGLYREFTVRVRRPAEAGYVDFGGATFEELAEVYNAAVKEDMTHIGDYIDAVFTPSRFEKAKFLADITRLMGRVKILLDRAEGVDFDRTRLNTYSGAVEALRDTADALADGDSTLAKDGLRKLQALVEQMQPGEKSALPADYFFRETTRNAIAELETRMEAAESRVAAAKPGADTQAAIAACRRADDAVARLLQFAPGRGAIERLTDEDAADYEAAIANLGAALPPSIVTARKHLSHLDEMLEHTPPSRTDGAYRAATLTALDSLRAAADRLEPAPWLGTFYEERDRAFLARVRAFWLQAHQTRFDESVHLCRELATDLIPRIAALSPSPAAAEEAAALFQNAQAMLDAVRNATNVTDNDKEFAAHLLSTASLRYAAFLFQLAPRTAEEDAQRTETIGKLLDAGLHQLPGASPDAVEEARALQAIFKLVGGARRSLAACLAANFATASDYAGDMQTLTDAVESYQRLAAEAGDHADNPSYRAALAPFTTLSSPSCQGFTLTNAAACWLLANAAKQATAGAPADALKVLRPFVAGSALRALMPAPLASRTDKLVQLVTAFERAARETAKAAWDLRIQAAPLLELDIPPAGAVGSVPAQYRGQEPQWAAIYGLMRNIVDHYRAAIEGEAELRKVEAAVAKFFTDGQPNPATATPKAVQAALMASAKLQGSGQCAAADQAARLKAVGAELGRLKTVVTGTADAIAKLLAKPDPKGALDAIGEGRAVLGADQELRLTQDALTSWVQQAEKAAKAGKHDAAAALYDAIQAHAQLRRHALVPVVKGALADAGKAASYARGHTALAAGALADALARFREAGDHGNAGPLVEQIAALQAAQAEKEPFQAAAALLKLSKRPDLEPALRTATLAEAEAKQKVLLVSADACLTKFHEGLTQGDWAKFIDRKALEDELEPIQNFLKQVDGLKVTSAPKATAVEVDAAKRSVRVTRKRTLTFAYRLTEADRFPMTLEQTIQWTVKFVPAGGGTWLIAAWEETD
ncbi:serine/threonine protein kinase [bacterium]|nr:serine/threonine protein kinase [bacterium]